LGWSKIVGTPLFLGVPDAGRKGYYTAAATGGLKSTSLSSVLAENGVLRLFGELYINQEKIKRRSSREILVRVKKGGGEAGSNSRFYMEG